MEGEDHELENEELVPADRLLVIKYISCWKTCIKKTLESKPMGHGLPLEFKKK